MGCRGSNLGLVQCEANASPLCFRSSSPTPRLSKDGTQLSGPFCPQGMESKCKCESISSVAMAVHTASPPKGDSKPSLTQAPKEEGSL